MKHLIPILFLVVSASAQWSYFRVFDAQGRWDLGTLDDATISVHQKGGYAQINIYAELSARNSTIFSATDLLKLDYQFMLPSDAVITDFWYWVDGKIMRGYLLDRWSSAAVYNGIERYEPALLHRDNSNIPNLVVKSVPARSSRKVLISYIVPTTSDSSVTTVSLPMSFLRSGRAFASELSVIYWPDSLGRLATLEGPAGSTSSVRLDSNGRTYQEFVIQPSDLPTLASVSYPSDFRNGVMARTFNGRGDGVFQISLIPSQILELNLSRRIAILVDYDSSKTTVTASQLSTSIGEAIKRTLTPADSFCILLGDSTHVQRVGAEWFIGNPDGVAAALDSLSEVRFTGTTGLPQLLRAGIVAAGTSADVGVIWLISSSTRYGDFSTSNEIIGETMNSTRGRIPMHIISIWNRSAAGDYHGFGGQLWPGNGYLFQNLSRLTDGFYTDRPISPTLSDFLSSSLAATVEIITSFEMRTTIDAGQLYDRNSTSSLRKVYVGRPFLQTGRFVGTPQFSVEVEGQFRGMPVGRRITILPQNVVAGDQVDFQAWAALKIAALENGGVTNAIIRQIISLSRDARVLSKYMEFLALEPGDTVHPCMTCSDESQLTSLLPHSVAPDDSVLGVFPNPFNSQTTLRLTLPNGVRPDESSFKIYNILGQEVHTFDVSLLREGEQRTFSWNGLSASGTPVATGVYLAVFQTPRHRHTVKLLMVK